MTSIPYSLCAQCSSLGYEKGNFYYNGIKFNCKLPYYHIYEDYRRCDKVLNCKYGSLCTRYICLLSHTGKLRGNAA